jgi:hypothetical protein
MISTSAPSGNAIECRCGRGSVAKARIACVERWGRQRELDPRRETEHDAHLEVELVVGGERAARCERGELLADVAADLAESFLHRDALITARRLGLPREIEEVSFELSALEREPSGCANLAK